MSFIFQKQKTRRQSKSYLGVWYQWEGGGYKEKLFFRYIWWKHVHMHVNGKMRPAETIAGMEKRE
jgi:hypothetical protein